MLNVLAADRYENPQFEAYSERCTGANERPLTRLAAQ